MSFVQSRLAPKQASFRVVATGSSQIVPTGTPVAINFTTKVWDTGDNYDLASDSFTVPFSGYYALRGSFRWGTGENSRVWFYVNGLPRVGYDVAQNIALFPLSAILNLQTDDVVHFMVDRISNSNDGTINDDTTLTYFSGYLLQET